MEQTSRVKCLNDKRNKDNNLIFLKKKKERKRKEEVIPLGLGDPLGAVGRVE